MKYYNAVFFLGAALVSSASGRALQPLDLVSLPRPGPTAVSPNGNLAVYSQSTYNVDENQSTANLELVYLNSTYQTQLTTPKLGILQSEPFFLDDQHIAYFESRGTESVNQLYVLNVDGQANPYQLTWFPIPFSNVKYNAKKQLLVFSAKVYPDEPTLEGTKLRDDELKRTKKDSGMVFDTLIIRYWDTFVAEKKNNLFVVQFKKSDDRYQVVGEPRNLLAGADLELAPTLLGGSSDYDISPNGEKVAFVSKITTPDNAWQTSQHVYIVPADGRHRPVAVNSDIPAASASPKYAPSGTLSYLQMLIPQYESDRNRIVLYDHGTRRYLAESWDRSPSELAFSPDSSKVYAVAEEYGRRKIFSIDVATEEIIALTNDHVASGVSVLSSGKLVFSVNSIQFPNVIYALDVKTNDMKSMGLSSELDAALSGIDLVKPEEFEFMGALGDKVHGWLVKPPNFDENAKYPVAFMIHGGPQGAWDDTWSALQNFQVFSGAGFVTVAINFHGSTGYGQKFCDSIQNNWGSHPFHDLEMGLDYLLETYSFLDAERIAALGGSYGGYMINWINGHSSRFKCLVNHDGVFSTVGSYYTIDVTYFLEREFGGVPFETLHRANYERWSPSNFVQNWRTPTLVIHSARDYRVVDTEGLSTFTALQRRGVPSRLLYFPDENHWVLRPANSIRWYKEVIEWFTKWTQPADSKRKSYFSYQLDT